ncbi:MAG: hypothetical protein ACI9XB_000223 [Gammaproteobacteria bacterium]|jgi:hypothetical protein
MFSPSIPNVKNRTFQFKRHKSRANKSAPTILAQKHTESPWGMYRFLVVLPFELGQSLTTSSYSSR